MVLERSPKKNRPPKQAMMNLGMFAILDGPITR
jgi:hypothetical protein